MSRNKCALHETKDGYIYVLEIGYDSLYKIGLSQKLHKRINSLNAANPKLKLEMAYLVLNVKKMEKFLHKRFETLHYDRELFKLDDANLKWLRRFLFQEQQKYIAIKKQRSAAASC